MHKHIIVILCVLFTIPADAEKPCYFSVSAGAGATSVQNARWELSSGLSASVANDNFMIGGRGLFSQELVLFRTPLRVNECALYYGKYFLSQNSSAFASLGGGLSFVSYALHGERYAPPNSWLGEYHRLIWKQTMGVSFDIQAGTNMGRFCSIGIHGFVSVNPVKTIAGAMLSMRIGLLDKL